MSETNYVTLAAQRTRQRAMIVPREHGAWGLVLVPLFTGSVVGLAPKYLVWELLLFTVAAVSLFALRTPVEILLGTGTVSARTPAERRAALIGCVGFATSATVSLTLLMWKGQYSQLLAIAGVISGAFFAQAVLRRFGRSTHHLAHRGESANAGSSERVRSITDRHVSGRNNCHAGSSRSA